MALVDHPTAKPARRWRPAQPQPASEMPDLGLSSAGGEVTTTDGHPVPQPRASTPDGQGPAPAIERDEAPSYGWTLFVGAIIGLACVKEILGRIGGNPVTVQARSVSRADTAFATAVSLRMLARIGSRVLGIPTTGS